MVPLFPCFSSPGYSNNVGGGHEIDCSGLAISGKLDDYGDYGDYGRVWSWDDDALNGLLALRLQQNGLSGTIPPEIGDVEKLQILHLGNNDLTGQPVEVLRNT